MKKVCLVDYDMSNWGGIERVIENMTNVFKKNYQVTVLSLCGDDSKKIEDAYNITLVKGVSRLRRVLIFGSIKMIKLNKIEKFDIIIVMGTCAGFFITLLKPFLRGEIIFADHGSLCSEINNRGITFMRYISSKFCNHTVVLTEKVRMDYLKHFNVNDKKITCIYDWIDPNVYEYVEKYESDSDKILTVGRISPEKGYDRLVKIAEKMLEKDVNWSWHIYGTGEDIDKLDNLIKKHGLENHVILKGLSSSILSEYKKYGVLALTSYREGLSLALLEAKANRLPLISFDIDAGPSEIILDGINGFLIEDGNLAQYAEKLLELMRNKKLRETFSAHAYDNIHKFNQPVISEQWFELINLLIEGDV